jgi:predicted DNA-binding transcriptional regulator YafY
LAKEPGKAYREPKFDPLLAIHRLKKVEMTERCFEYPADYDFNEVFDRSFGLVKEDCFEVEMEFQGWAADYVAERTWSPDQKISKVYDDKIRITFSASSEVELLAWILSFGEEARVIQPEWLIKEICNRIKKTGGLYGIC